MRVVEIASLGKESKTVLSMVSSRWSRSRLSSSSNWSKGWWAWCGELLCEHDEPWPLSDDDESSVNLMKVFCFV